MAVAVVVPEVIAPIVSIDSRRWDTLRSETNQSTFIDRRCDGMQLPVGILPVRLWLLRWEGSSSR
jgi:hypothetical protein